MRDLDEVTGHIVDAALKLHMRLGPGLLESVYERVLARDLVRRGLHVQRQAAVPFDFEGMHIEDGLRLDLIVERKVIVEIKAVDKLAPIHWRQLLTYLRVLNQPVGLLINFGEMTLKRGLHRVVNNYVPAAPRALASTEGTGGHAAGGLATPAAKPDLSV